MVRRVSFLILMIISAVGHASDTSVDGERLNRSIADIREIGLAKSGGSSRTAFGADNKTSLEYVSAIFMNLGYEVSIDAAANLVAVKVGTEPGLAPIMTGSHLDAVPNGGH